MSVSDNLKTWFDGLSRQEQEEIVKYLYGGKMLLQEGLYVGPHPNAVYKGLHCGPVPSGGASCPTCGRPY
jgi:hypothetical protein